jgi:hypothetical protein
MTVTHASSREDVKDILSLGEMDTRGGSSDRNSEKMMKKTKIFHGKFGAKRFDDGPKEGGGGSGQNYIIDIEKEIC